MFVTTELHCYGNILHYIKMSISPVFRRFLTVRPGSFSRLDLRDCFNNLTDRDRFMENTKIQH